MRVACISVVWLLAVGCATRPEPIEFKRQLPFIVKVRETHAPESPRGDAATPVPRGGYISLSSRIAAVIEQLELFSVVVSDGGDNTEADLELEVSFVGSDFGPGYASLGGGVFSSLTWLMAGHASWWIRDRHYPDSDVALVVSLHRPGQRTDDRFVAREKALFEDVLQLNGLDLAYRERAGTAGSLLNIVVPPMLIEGNTEAVGVELVGRAIDLFARQEPEQLLARLPGSSFAAERCFVIYDESTHSLLLAADEALVQVTLLASAPGAATRRELDADAIGGYGIPTGQRFEKVRLTFSTRAPGVTARRYYSVPLAPSERGLVRLRTVLNNGKTAGPWTLRVPAG
jgi:hypothetical protein